ncbi:MAG: flagellar motor switch protein FliN [Bacteriovoracaceae bacterium]
MTEEEKIEEQLEQQDVEGSAGTSDDGDKEGAWVGLDYLSNVPLKVIVELGQTEIKLGELLRLQKGSTLELNKLAGEPLEFFLGGELAARGEVVVINEKFGIRLTDVINPEGEEHKLDAS